MLTDIIPASWRKAVYAIFALIAAAEGAMHTAYVTIGVADPKWLLIALSVTAYVGIAIGAVAASNITPVTRPPVTPAAVVAVPAAAVPAITPAAAVSPSETPTTTPLV